MRSVSPNHKRAQHKRQMKVKRSVTDSKSKERYIDTKSMCIQRYFCIGQSKRKEKPSLRKFKFNITILQEITKMFKYK